jgi:uncharacterized protein (DUF885 family)
MPEDIEKTIQRLNDALTVTAAIQERHARLLGDHEDSLNAIHKMAFAQNKMLAAQSDAMLSQIETAGEHRREIDRLNKEAAEFRRAIEKTLASITEKLEEATDKLNGIIGYVEGQHKPPQ